MAYRRFDRRLCNGNDNPSLWHSCAAMQPHLPDPVSEDPREPGLPIFVLVFTTNDLFGLFAFSGFQSFLFSYRRPGSLSFYLAPYTTLHLLAHNYVLQISK